MSSADLPARVVDNLLDNTTDVSVLLGVVQVSELGRCLVQVGVALENPTILSLTANLRGGDIVRTRTAAPTEILTTRPMVMNVDEKGGKKADSALARAAARPLESLFRSACVRAARARAKSFETSAVHIILLTRKATSLGEFSVSSGYRMIIISHKFKLNSRSIFDA